MDEKFPIGEHIVDHLSQEGQSLATKRELSDWAESSAENKVELNNYKKIWDASADAPVIRKFDTGEAWQKVDSEIELRNSRTRRIRNIGLVLSGVAASLLIFVSLNFFTDLFSSSEALISMTTTYGSRSEVTLPDGSLVKLNAGSNIKYHYDKISQIRKVDFSGEAYFEVAKSNKPFEILTPDGLKVKVLGTKFNLSTYPDDQTAQTSLFEGKVELSKADAADLVLKPGEMAVWDKNSNRLIFGKGEVARSTGWMQNKLYMENMSLADVCKYVERWYDVQITLQDSELGETLHYTGVLKEQTAIDVLNALCQLSSISYELKGKEITIRKK
jgi:ferric-dicitrate binding protein FerR (iron transport regulator)